MIRNNAVRMLIAASAVIGGSVGVTGMTASAAPSTTVVTAASASSCTPAARFTIWTKRAAFKGAPETYDLLNATPACRGSLGVGTLAVAIKQARDTDLAAWRRDVDPRAVALGAEYTRHNSVKVNEAGLVVVEAETYASIGGAHGVSYRDDFVLNTRTGRLLSTKAMVAELQRLGGPRWNLIREAQPRLDRAVGRSMRPPTPLTVADLDVYPTRAGLHVSVDHCRYYSCAAGLVEATIPWNRLVGPGVDVSYLPNRWGH